MKPSTYSEYITKAVLADRESNIMVIRDLKIIKGLPFLSTEYPLILKLMKEKNIEGIVKLEKKMHTKTVDDLCLITFCNQEGKKYLASIYDSDELLQDPQVIDMIPID